MSKILLVEDEFFIAELVRRRLDEVGHEVTEAADSEEALQALESFTPDLILMDIGLGEFSLDGWELNRKIKESPATASIPIIAVTAHAQSEEHHKRALSEGFVDHVAKPIDFDLLLRTITEQLQQGPS